MKYCYSCGNQLEDNANFCDKCGKSQVENAKPVVTTDNSEAVVSVLCYFSLWIIGMFAPSLKNNPKIRFHVSQGIVLTMTEIALSVANLIINAVLKVFTMTNYTLYATFSTVGTLIGLAFTAFSIFLAVKGILNACHDKQVPLPIIGRFAFYK